MQLSITDQCGGKSYKGSTVINYVSKAVADYKTAIITTRDT